jgi:hypothetical protein
MNLAQVLALEWSDEYKVCAGRQKFKVIKWRAKGKIQSFEIQSVFLKHFKNFIRLRHYILQGKSYERLFVSLGTNRLKAPEPMKDFIPRRMYSRLRDIDPTLPNITPRQWRAASIDWMFRMKIPLSVAADVAQNSESAIKTSYTAGSPETHREEMTSFFNRISSVVLSESQKIEGAQEGPVGLCVNYGAPSALQSKSRFFPDCRNPEGCLFCGQYKVHADEHDTRKLVSCRYCIRCVEPLASSKEHFEGVFGSVLERIQQLLSEIGQRAKDSSMVERVEKSVDENGELDVYWLAKLEMLIQLNLVYK